MARALPVLDGETPFQQDYMPVLLDVIKQLKAGLVDSLHSIYVFGSVARREAKAGMSDLNLTVIVQRPAYYVRAIGSEYYSPADYFPVLGCFGC